MSCNWCRCRSPLPCNERCRCFDSRFINFSPGSDIAEIVGCFWHMRRICGALSGRRRKLSLLTAELHRVLRAAKTTQRAIPCVRSLRPAEVASAEKVGMARSWYLPLIPVIRLLGQSPDASAGRLSSGSPITQDRLATGRHLWSTVAIPGATAAIVVGLDPTAGRYFRRSGHLCLDDTLSEHRTTVATLLSPDVRTTRLGALSYSGSKSCQTCLQG
jgi:hypothetical protein